MNRATIAASTAASLVAVAACGGGAAQVAEPSPGVVPEPAHSPATAPPTTEAVPEATTPDRTVTTATSQPPGQARIEVAAVEPPEPVDVPWSAPEPPDTPAGDVEWLVRQAWPEQPDFAAAVADCESSFDPGVVSSAGHVGVMQLSPVHAARAARLGYTWAQMYQAGPNIAVARNLYDEQGWRPWSCAA